MAWLQSLDIGLLRFINLQWQHPALDAVMKFLSGNALFFPVLVLVAALLIWKGGVRGRVLVVLLAVILLAGDNFVIAMLKKVVDRPRPFLDIPDLHVPVGRGPSGSMPSSHASSWFAATLLLGLYYRRSWRFMLPLACAVGLSRIYLGVHYPSDVVAGAALGAGYAAAGLVLLNNLWQRGGKAWFPLWWAELPSLVNPDARLVREKIAAIDARPAARDRHWLRLGYLVIGLVLVSRLAFLAGGAIELSKDEAYQWLWSKHLALSYYSKPPMIAYAQWLGTSIWGDTAFGVRFLSPVIGALLAGLVLRFMARVAEARTGFWLVLVLLATPLLAIGSTLLTIDPLLVLFWTLAVIVGWRAVQPDAKTWHWLGVGLSMGLAFLSKYSALYLLVCWAIFFAWCRPARAQLRRAGPYLALGVNLLCTLPVILWNVRHSWITLDHVSERSGLQQAWQPTPRFFLDFLFAEGALLNPVFFVGALWAMGSLLRRRSNGHEQAGGPPLDQRALMIYLFCMGPTVFLGHWLYGLYTRVQPNWVAPAVVPMCCLMVLHWDRRWREGARWVRPWLTTGLALGFAALALMHEPKIVEKLVHRPLPPDKDPLRRVRAWTQTAQVVESARSRLRAEGKPVFVIAHHYGITALLAFYTPEARAVVGTTPEVYYLSSSEPRNQLYFWPHYRYRERRKGQNAIYVVELDPPRYSLGAWLKSVFARTPEPEPAAPRDKDAAPAALTGEFDSVKDLGVQPVALRGRVYRRLHLYECRNLR